MNNELDRLEQMLRAQLELQRGYGYDIAAMTTEERVEYARFNQQALNAESIEALDETSWKPWAKGVWFNGDAYVGELVDGWHFFMNMLLNAAQGSPARAAELLFGGYIEKNSINRRRQETGYDAISTKCPRCKRALDESGAIDHGELFPQYEYACAACGTELLAELVMEVQSTWSEARSIKCPGCSRELGSPGAIVRIDMPTTAEPNRVHWMCNACGHPLNDEFIEAMAR